jgi:hypothetical protein
VSYNGTVIWRATPTAIGFPNGRRTTRPAFQTTGVDGSHEWAWTVGGAGKLAIAVDTYATKPNGTTNRTLNGMTPPYPTQGKGQPLVAEQRTQTMWDTFTVKALKSTAAPDR